MFLIGLISKNEIWAKKKHVIAVTYPLKQKITKIKFLFQTHK